MFDPQIFLIEPDDFWREIFSNKLRDYNYNNVQSFCSGGEALLFARSRPPELIVLELNLPDIDSLELLQRLRRQSRLQSLPAFMFTHSEERKDYESCLEAGVSGYFLKAKARIEDLLSAIDSELS